MSSTYFENKNIIITGGTDGIGAASAIELCKLGANVRIVGRSEEKARALQELTENYSGKLSYIISDFSLLKNVVNATDVIIKESHQIDIIIHSVGTLTTKKQHTEEGLERNFAVSYLSRFVFNEILFLKQKLSKNTIIINVAASAPKVPSFAQMDFDNVSEVRSRVGLKSHKQAQLANDLYTAFLAQRYGVVSIGYGPGSVDTNIRREIPKVLRMLMKPFAYLFTRKPADVAKQFIEILSTVDFETGSYFYNTSGQFKIARFVDDKKRQSDLLNTTLALINPILGK